MAKREYVRHEYRMLAYRSVLDTYYPKERTILSPLRVTILPGHVKPFCMP